MPRTEGAPEPSRPSREPLRGASGTGPGMRPILAVLVVALAVTAGCLGGDGDEAGTSADADPPNPAETRGEAGLEPPDAPEANVSSAEAPAWEEGQWFAYDRSGPWTEGTEGRTRLVVADASGPGYVTGYADRDAFAVDLFWFNNPLLGDLDAGLEPQLPAEGNPPPRILDWPLEDGKTWETSGWEDDWIVSAQLVDAVDTAVGTFPGYEILANGTRADRIEATYVPEVGALTSFRVHWSSEGGPSYALDLADAGTGHDAPVWVGTPEVHMHTTWTASDLVPPERSFDVTEEATDLYASVQVRDGSGVRLKDPDGATRYREAAGPGMAAWDLVTVEDPPAGSWTWQAATSGNQACADSDAARPACGGVFLRTAALSLEEAG